MTDGIICCRVLNINIFLTIVEPLMKPRVVGCEVDNWDVMRCSWTPAKQETTLQNHKVELFWSYGP